MELTNRYKRVLCKDIIVKRGERQRTTFDTSDLEPSIRARGVLTPILVDKDLVLVFGERRLTASIKLGLPDIPCRFVEDLDPIEAQIIELEENLKRKDLSWRDSTNAIGRLHDLYEGLDPEWTQVQTANAIGVTDALVSMTLRVYRDIASPRLAQATSLGVAYGMLGRLDDRKASDVISDILNAGSALFGDPDEQDEPDSGDTEPELDFGIAAASVWGETSAPSPAQSKPRAIEPDPILNTDFIEWASKYEGQPFNFIHCDFPYGVNYNAGKMSGRDKWETYDDNPDIYWQLIDALCDNLDRIMAHSAHLMFWLAADIEMQVATLQHFAEKAPSLTFQTYPLVWLKSDNVGVLPDSKRGPRRIIETALIASREDRLIVKPVANGYAAQTAKAVHPSAKPEPVLRHFFQMFVDDNTRLLDPTCGGASSLRAAESLGARHVFGLELSPEHYANGISAMKNFRALRRAAG